MFGRATIRLGIGPHSSWILLLEWRMTVDYRQCTLSCSLSTPLDISFWATVCKTVRPMLSDRCLSCPVCLIVCLSCL